jgi:hypothetical protein
VATGAAGISANVNLSPVLAIHGRTMWISEGPSARPQFNIGMRATFIRTPRWSMYGVALPGWYTPSSPAFHDHRHFTLDLGIGLTFRIGPALSAKVELDRDIHAIGDTVVVTGPDTRLRLEIPGIVGSRWNAIAAVEYGFGGLLAAAATASSRNSWTLGPQMGYTISPNATAIGVVGGFVSHRLGRVWDFDGSISTSVTADLPSRADQGGRLLQAVGGIKLGVREGPFGVFFKLRGGLNSWSKVVDANGVAERWNTPLIDLGGVFEYAVTKNEFLRFDVGEGVIVALQRVRVFELSSLPAPDHGIYTLPMRVGFGVAF